MAVKSLFAAPRFKTCFFLILLLSAAGCTREKENPKSPGKEQSKVSRPSSEENAGDTLLTTIPTDQKPPHAIPGHSYAPESNGEQVAAMPGHEAGAQSTPDSFQVLFSESGRGAAYLVEKDKNFYVVHNRSKGKSYPEIATVVLSADGRRVAYPARVDKKWRMVVDGKEGSSYDGLLTPIFSPDGNHVLYQAKQGDTWFLVVDNTPNAGTLASYTTPEFNSDSNMIVYIEAAASAAEMKLIVSDLQFGRQSVKKSIGDLLFTTSSDKTRIAATQVVDRKLRVIDFSFAKPDQVREGKLYDLIEKLIVSDDGSSVSYCALKDKTRLVVLDDKEEVLPKGLLPELPVIRPDKKGVGLLLGSQQHIELQQSFFNGTEKRKRYDEASGLSYSKDGRFSVFAAREGRNWFIVVNGKEGPVFDRAVAPLFSPDGKCIVYRARRGAQRFVVVADTNGQTLKEHPAYEQVFQPVFVRDGKAVAYGVKDGSKLIRKVEGL
jgi:hypothetical protein